MMWKETSLIYERVITKMDGSSLSFLSLRVWWIGKTGKVE